jgi:hypothetical protein
MLMKNTNKNSFSLFSTNTWTIETPLAHFVSVLLEKKEM